MSCSGVYDKSVELKLQANYQILYNNITFLESTLEKYYEFVAELLGEPTGPSEGKEPDNCFYSVMKESPQRIEKINSELVCLLNKLREIVL